MDVPKLVSFEGQLQLALSTVHTLKKTSIAAINRLPQEVIALVPTHFDPRSPGDTLNATHVCRYWRAALVSSPTLWTITDATRMMPSLIQLYLERSGMSPLDVTLGAKTPEHTLQKFVERAPRIRLLSFEVMPWTTWKAVSECFSVSALHTLSDLRISAETEVGSTGLDSALFPHAPNLRHLFFQISGPPVPILPHISFPSLKTIEITFQGGYTSHLIATLGQLLGVLRSSPLLEDVSLKFHELTIEPGVSHHSVLLPRLQKFYIACGSTPIPLLTSINFPPTACVLARAGSIGGRPSDDQICLFGRHLSPLVSGSDELIFHSSKPVYSSKTLFLFTLHLKRNGETRVQLQYWIVDHPMSSEQTLVFLAACPLGTIRRFLIEGRTVRKDVTDNQVSGTMQHLTNVETLLLRNSAHLLPLLLPGIQGGQAPCPTLKTLVIDGNQEVPHQELSEVVRARAEAGSPLRRVILPAGYPEGVVGELHQFVNDVE